MIMFFIMTGWAFSGIIGLIMNEDDLDIYDKKMWPTIYISIIMGPLTFVWYRVIKKIQEGITEDNKPPKEEEIK